MPITKHLAELGVLLVEDIYGELPSRVLATLFDRGRSNLPYLTQRTALSPRHVRHALATLIQFSLVYWSVDPTTKATMYEANPEAVYNLARTGKILEAVESARGSAAKAVVLDLLFFGLTRIEDLHAAYSAKFQSSQSGQKRKADEALNGDDDAPLPQQSAAIKSIGELNAVLGELLRCDLVEIVVAGSFMSPEQRRQKVYDEIQKDLPDSLKGAKRANELEKRLAEGLAKLRDEPKRLKRSLQGISTSRLKSRKLTNGDVTNGFDHGDIGPPLAPETVLRVNLEKCLVELRNFQLAQVAEDFTNPTTGRVFAALLKVLTEDTPRCQLDRVIDNEKLEERVAGRRHATTGEIFRALEGSVDLAEDIGQPDDDKMDLLSIEKINKTAHAKRILYPDLETPVGQETGGDAEGEPLSDDDDAQYDSEGQHMKKPNGVNGVKGAKTNGVSTAAGKAQLLRRHLLILCESEPRFARHCGRGQWTVDFEALVRDIQIRELDAVVESVVGRDAMRLISILREKGKLDEKALATISLRKKGDMQHMLYSMLNHGFVDIQEVPKDASRAVNRTMFYWFTNTGKSLMLLQEKTLKAMLRTYQVREIQRQKNAEVLSFVERPDVKGREKDVLEKKYYEAYSKYRQMEDKLLAEMGRLDSVVAILRDY